MILSVENLSMHYQRLEVFSHVNFSLEAGQVAALVGANGCGKTVLLNLICGIDQPTDGTIRIAGTSITGWSADRIARLGVARQFQDARVLPHISLIDNIALACMQESGSGNVWKSFRLFAPWALGHSRSSAQKHLASLKSVAFSDLGRSACRLSVGEQRLLSFVRVQASCSRLWILDEPTAGLSEHSAAEVCDIIRDAATRFNAAVLFVEHRSSVVKALADVVYQLEAGRLTELCG